MQTRQQPVDVLDLKAGVVQAGAAGLDVAADGSLVLAGAARAAVVDDSHRLGIDVLQELQIQVSHRDERDAQAADEFRLVAAVDHAVLVGGESLGLGGDFHVGLGALHGPFQFAGEHFGDLGVVGAGHPEVVYALHLSVRGRLHRQGQGTGQVGYGSAGGRRIQQNPARSTQSSLGLRGHHRQIHAGGLLHCATQPVDRNRHVMEPGLLRPTNEWVSQLEQRNCRLPHGEYGRLLASLADVAISARQLKIPLKYLRHRGNVADYHANVGQSLAKHRSSPPCDSAFSSYCAAVCG